MSSNKDVVSAVSPRVLKTTLISFYETSQKKLHSTPHKTLTVVNNKIILINLYIFQFIHYLFYYYFKNK